MKNQFPSSKELKNIPIHGLKGLFDYYASKQQETKRLGQTRPVRLLVEASDFKSLLDALGEFQLSEREIKLYSASRLGLMPPAVEKEGKTCYIYPDHFEIFQPLMVLRKKYHLPLAVIQRLIKAFPGDKFHVIVAQNLSADDLWDLGKMAEQGFDLKDVIMAKACDVMVEDVVSPTQLLAAAADPGDRLKDLEEKTLLNRLDELKKWVKSGRRQRFVRRESASDFRDLAVRQRFAKRLRMKLLARQLRSLSERVAAKK